MKIKRIEFENFRNFRNRGYIECSTDKKITIIYGKNGDGKTTLHQLFQWIFYGKVHFNQTTTDKLYNLSFEEKLPINKEFQVLGRIDFEHDGVDYSISRVQVYKKGLRSSDKKSEDLTLLKMNSDYSYLQVQNPQDAIEKMLPTGLSDYFFFDGESMIADLRVKGKESANNLRRALYTMFNLDVLEAAINHIGDTDRRTTVLGKLYLNKGTVISGVEISNKKAQIEKIQNYIEKFKNDIERDEETKEKINERIDQISEEIGTTKSKADYESRRKGLEINRNQLLEDADSFLVSFGNAVANDIPSTFVAKATQELLQQIKVTSKETNLPYGISKELVEYLLSDQTDSCICGNPLHEKEKKIIRDYLMVFPPNSYQSQFQTLNNTVQNWSGIYDKENLVDFIQRYLNSLRQANNCDEQIANLDEQAKKAPDIEDLIVERQQAAKARNDLIDTISKNKTEKKKYEIALKNSKKEFDELTNQKEEAQKVIEEINIMKAVLAIFIERLNEASKKYSEGLEENIQLLIDTMLTSKRWVKVSPDFSVCITDSFGDESKSEGQFAVVSFAYIGGILKMLQQEERLSSKEYPLVLDGPFSKLDPEQRQNVINTIPEFAPQIILFSKDNLQQFIPENKKGRVWTIVSNDEKNIAEVKEGLLWN